MFLSKSVSLCLLVLCSTGAVYAQSSSNPATIPLIVDQGFPIQVIVTEKFRFEKNEPVYAKTVEPVYAFDREVIPSGSQVLGRITGFRGQGKLKRFFRMLGGDFTPARDPQIKFDTLVLSGGKQMPIDTLVTSDGGKKPRTRNVKKFFWALSPYHPQRVETGGRLRAMLIAPLDFGSAVFEAGALDELGSQPPSGTIVTTRLATSLNSRSAEPGASVEAILTRPIFSLDDHLIFPVGSRLGGEVQDVNAARKFHRNGQLAFKLTTIELPENLLPRTLAAQKIEARLVAVQGPGVDHVRVDKEGATRIYQSKMRFIAPLYSFVKAGRAINSTADPLDTALLGAYRSKLTKQFGGNSTGLGIAGSISGAMVPPIGMGLGFYGAARSAYSNFLGKGQDIEFPSETLMEFRLE
jgi:hypothetical protein